MYRIEEKAGLDWLSTQVLDCISPVLGLPWIRKIPAALATFTTVISWQIYASASASKCAPGMNMPLPKAYPDFGKC
jgi:hypothetical protein